GILTAAGVKVSIITDHPVVPIEFLVDQAALAVKHGMAPADALRAITLNPAEVLGVADRIGSLAPGKDADLVLWEGDPLDVRNRTVRVWQAGREVMHRDGAGEAVIAARGAAGRRRPLRPGYPVRSQSSMRTSRVSTSISTSTSPPLLRSISIWYSTRPSSESSSHEVTRPGSVSRARSIASE